MAGAGSGVGVHAGAEHRESQGAVDAPSVENAAHSSGNEISQQESGPGGGNRGHQVVDEEGDEEDFEAGHKAHTRRRNRSVVTLVAIAAIVLLIPLMYRASPECAKTVALLAPYCASLPGPLGNSTSLQGACLASSRGVRAAMAGGFTLLHLVTAALLPLPAQPGTEQYWDVRARRALREMLVPTSIERTEIASLLLAPCRALPLQHYCNLSSTWGSERLRWHLDMMHDLLHSDRVTVQSGPGECEGGSCDEEQSCPGGGSAAVRRPVAAAREPRSQERGAARGGAGVASTSGKRSGRGAVSAPRGDQGAKGRRSGYDRLCERQFGVGAMFDGEMCACKSGFAVRKGVCERTPTA
ncbi:hypothetical protein T484DRAFT_1784769, partial [Baffinella frigidus]